MVLSGVLAVGGCGGLSSNQAAVRHVIEDLRAAATHHDFVAACALLDPRLAAAIAHQMLGPPRTCAASLAAVSTRAPGPLGDLPTGPIRMRGNCGYVAPTCHGTECAAIAPLTVCRERGRWLLRAF
jgi:hypothetical protein